MSRKDPTLKAITSGDAPGALTSWLNEVVAARTQQPGDLVDGSPPDILIVPDEAYELSQLPAVTIWPARS